MSQTAEVILGALAAYRAHISEVNHRAMEVIIPRIEAADPDPEDYESPEEIAEARLDYLRNILGGPTEPALERPADVLSNWDVIIQQLALDGAKVHLDSEWRARRRQIYRSGILEGLGRYECPDGQWALPSDFEVLMNEVDSLEGGGWYKIRDLVFWDGWGAGWGIHETPEHIRQRVLDSQGVLDLVIGVGEDYDVAGGWVLGSGNEAKCLAMYSRLKKDESQTWSWRYVAALGQFGTEVFDTLASVLDWYKTSNEPREEDLNIEPEEVFSPF